MLNLSPAHLHLALNHIPIIGLVVATFPIVIGIVAQCRTTIATGLIATLLCAAAMPAIMKTGGQAAHAFDDGTALPPLDAAGQNALDTHASRADTTTPVIYASALLALLALLTLIKLPKAATWLAFAVLLGNTASILLSIWTADAGGHIRHLELRSKTSLTAPVENSKPADSKPAEAPSPAPSALPTATPMTTTAPTS
ncbi:MAG: hypothetical protein ACOYK6_03125 [Chthoniobacterales bacterium]